MTTFGKALAEWINKIRDRRRPPAVEVDPLADIVRIIGDRVKLRRVGFAYVGLCPFHKEQTPSFIVWPREQRFECVSCDLEGNATRFLVLYHELTIREAEAMLERITDRKT